MVKLIFLNPIFQENIKIIAIFSNGIVLHNMILLIILHKKVNVSKSQFTRYFTFYSFTF